MSDEFQAIEIGDVRFLDRFRASCTKQALFERRIVAFATKLVVDGLRDRERACFDMSVPTAGACSSALS